MAEPPRGQRDGDGKGDAVGQAEQGPEADRSGDAAEARAKRPQPIEATISGSGAR